MEALFCVFGIAAFCAVMYVLFERAFRRGEREMVNQALEMEKQSRDERDRIAAEVEFMASDAQKRQGGYRKTTR